MPDNVDRRNFSLSPHVSEAIDIFAEENNMNKSEVVENAVLEYTENDRVARIESKIDDVLAEVSGNSYRGPGGKGTLSGSHAEQKKIPRR